MSAALPAGLSLSAQEPPDLLPKASSAATSLGITGYGYEQGTYQYKQNRVRRDSALKAPFSSSSCWMTLRFVSSLGFFLPWRWVGRGSRPSGLDVVDLRRELRRALPQPAARCWWADRLHHRGGIFRCGCAGCGVRRVGRADDLGADVLGDLRRQGALGIVDRGSPTWTASTTVGRA
jgi:hypothetical protein